MISAILTVGALVVVGIGGPVYALFSEKQTTYGSDLEQYIISRNPCDIADVERLTSEYDRKQKETFL